MILAAAWPSAFALGEWVIARRLRGLRLPRAASCPAPVRPRAPESGEADRTRGLWQRSGLQVLANVPSAVGSGGRTC
jgi:hypothetical protein